MEKEFEKYRAEFWAVSQARKLDLPLENVLVRPIGSFERGTKDDIAASYNPDDSQSIEDYLTINVRRESVLSRLAEAEVSAFLEEVGLDEGDVEENRDKVSLPLDLEFNHFRILLEEFEQQKAIDGSIFLYEAAGIDEDDNLKQVKRVITSTIPRLHRIAGSLVEMEKVFSQALGNTVKLTLRRLFKSNNELESRFTNEAGLGTARLGSDFVIGELIDKNKQYVDIEVSVDSNRILDFLPDGWGAKAIELLCEYLFPFEYEYSVVLNHPHESLILSTDEHVSLLGYTTYL